MSLKLDRIHWWTTSWANRWFSRMPERHGLHAPEHIGMFAGSLLARVDWDHDWRARDICNLETVTPFVPFTGS